MRIKFLKTDKQNRASRKPLPKSIWILSFISFFADISSEMMVPLLPLFLVGALGATQIQLGIMEGAAVLIVSLMSAYAGFRSDRRGIKGGRVRWLNWGYGLPVLGKSIIAVVSSPLWILLGRLLDRFGKGLRGAPRDALIVDAVEPKRLGEAFGLHRALDTAGALVGTTLASFLLWSLAGLWVSSCTECRRFVCGLGAACIGVVCMAKPI
jgi:hypothetical protein